MTSADAGLCELFGFENDDMVIGKPIEMFQCKYTNPNIIKKLTDFFSKVHDINGPKEYTFRIILETAKNDYVAAVLKAEYDDEHDDLRLRGTCYVLGKSEEAMNGRPVFA